MTTATSRRKAPKSNAQKCREYRQRNGKTISLPLPESTHKALSDLMERHGHEDRREAIATMIHRLHEAGPDGSARFLSVFRHAFTPSDELVQRLLVEGAKTREEV